MIDLPKEDNVIQLIFLIRGCRIMLDRDLARLYGVSTKRLNEQVRRNKGRFPNDFMFRLSPEETGLLRSQFATSKKGRGGRRYFPYAFTEHGAVMLANVLNGPIAIRASVQVVRAFVRLREMMSTNKELSRRLDELEKTYDAQFKVVFEAIRELMEPPSDDSGRIGFKP